VRRASNGGVLREHELRATPVMTRREREKGQERVLMSCLHQISVRRSRGGEPSRGRRDRWSGSLNRRRKVRGLAISRRSRPGPAMAEYTPGLRKSQTDLFSWILGER
jgi:hypothetical protein